MYQERIMDQRMDRERIMDKTRRSNLELHLWRRRMERLSWQQREDELFLESKFQRLSTLRPESKEFKELARKKIMEKSVVASWWSRRMELENDPAIASPIENLWQGIRQLLTVSRVIGDVVNDFLPCMDFDVFFAKNQIKLGEYLSPVDVQSEPRALQFKYESTETRNALRNSRFILVMTELRASCESLLWLTVNYFPVDSSTWQHTALTSLIPYMPPTSNLIVFTLFKLNESRGSIDQHFVRDIFSTRAFAGINDLGAPLGAAFSYVEMIAPEGWNFDTGLIL